MLALSALRLLLEYGTEVLVPTRKHAKASESVQLQDALMILGCKSRTLSDITRANLGVQLLSSRKDIAKLKWQHGLHGLLVDRLEGVLYDQGLQAQDQGRD